MKSKIAMPVTAGSRTAEFAKGSGGRGRPQGTAAERDAIYLHNEEMRLRPQPLGCIDANTPVSVLGLEQTTISRLYRAGLVQLEVLLRCSVEGLWRNIGRHGICNILDRLEVNGLAPMPLTEYEKWRLGRVTREAITLRIGLETAVAELWPMLGITLTQSLRKRGMRCVADLASLDEDGLLQLYRLGKANLRRIRSILLDVGRNLDGEAALRLRRSLDLMSSYLDSHKAVPHTRR